MTASASAGSGKDSDDDRGRAGKILVVTNDFPPRRGGIESFVYSLCNALPSGDVVVYTAKMDGASDIDRRADYPVVRDPRRLLLPTRRAARAIRDVATEHGCHSVVFGAAAPLGLLAPSLRRAGIQQMVALTHGHEVWWARSPVARRLLRRIGDEVDVLTYVSDFCRGAISPGLSEQAAARMVRLSPPVDLNRFTPHADGSPWRERWQAGHRPVVLAAGRLVARKGHDVLLRAWPLVLATSPSAVLVIIGDGPLRRRLSRRARRRGVAGSVRIVAGVPWTDMPGVYAAADVFALPCRTRLHGLEPEALGMVYLEAAASGLPVVVGSSGGAPETVLDGRTGFVVDPRDAAEVARRISTLLAAPARARAMGLRGRRWVGERFAGNAADEVRRLLDAEAT